MEAVEQAKMDLPPTKERVKLWRVSALPNLELLRAAYRTQSFARHTHEGFAVGVIEQGALGFFYRGENVTAATGAINLANPDEAHTGHAATEEGWTYRMFYFEAEVLRKAASKLADRKARLPFFQSGVIHDDHLAEIIGRLHRDLEDERTSTLEKESRFLLMLTLLIQRHADAPPPLRTAGREHPLVLKARDYIRANFSEDISLKELAAIGNMSPFHFLRVFTKETGVPPHAYLNQVRLRRARELLATGWSIAATACETGFVDQSHLSRRFKQIFGITPGQYSNFIQYGHNLRVHNGATTS
jgi:AraC-like DNA-binding protein